jgi:hypothetical protein
MSNHLANGNSVEIKKKNTFVTLSIKRALTKHYVECVVIPLRLT